MGVGIPILVAGLGRCGTSMVMRMLSVGGIPVMAEYPGSYEHMAFSVGRSVADALPELGTRTAKCLDPHQLIWPNRLAASVVWLDRDYKEQAKSQSKFVRMLSGCDVPGNAWRLVVPSLKSDTRRCLRMFSRLGVRLIRIKFEAILSDPLAQAAAIGLFIEREFDHKAAANVVVKRTPQCAPGLDLELAGLKRRIGC